MTTLLIPAAGRSERYAAAGYQTPKPLLMVEYHSTHASMLGHVIEHLGTSPYLVALPPGCASKYGGISVESSSHMETILLLLQGLPDYVLKRGIILADCDMLVDSRDLLSVRDAITRDDGPDVAVLVVDREIPGFSYPVLDRGGRLIGFNDGVSVVPRQTVSVCSLRAFRRGHSLLRMVESSVYKSDDVTDMMNALAPLTELVYAKHPVVDWGTPLALAASGARIITGAE